MRTWRTRVFSTLVLSSRNLSDWLSFGIRLMLRELGCLVVHLWSQHMFLSLGGKLNMFLAGTWITQFDLFFILVCVCGEIYTYADIYIILVFQFHSLRPSKIIETLMRQKCYFMPIYCQGFLWKPTIPHIQVSTLPVINLAPEKQAGPQKEFHLPTIHFKGIPVCFGERYAGCCTYHPTFVFLSLFHQKKSPPQILQTIRPGCLMFGFRTEVCFWIGRFSQKSPRETLPTCDQTPDSGSLHFCIRDWTGWPLTLRDFVAWRFLIHPVFLPHSFLDPRFGTSSLLARDLAGWRAAERFSLERHHMCLLLPKSCGWAWQHNPVWQRGIVQMHPTVAGWWFQILHFFFHPLPGEIIQFDWYFSNGLVQQPTRWFGSVDNFNHLVHTEVRAAFRSQMTRIPFGVVVSEFLLPVFGLLLFLFFGGKKHVRSILRVTCFFLPQGSLNAFCRFCTWKHVLPWMENWKKPQGYWWLVGIATTILWYHLDLSISRGNNWTFMVAYLSSSIPWLFWISPGLACLMFGLQVKCHPLIGYLMYQFLGGGNSNIFLIFTPKLGEDFSNLTHIFSDGLVQPRKSGLFLASFGCIGTWAGCSSLTKFWQSSRLSSAHYPCLLRCCASSPSQEWRRWCRKLVRLRCKTNNPLYLGMFEPWVAVSNIFYFHPRKLGFHDPIWRAYFSNGLKPPTRTPLLNTSGM